MKIRLLLIFACLVTLLGGCETPAPQPQKPTPAPVEEIPPPAPADPVEQLLEQAARSAPAAAVDLRLEAAAELLRRENPRRAAETLDPLAAASLSSAQWVRLSVLKARCELAAGRAAAALELLANPALQSEVAELAPALQVELALARSQSMEATRMFAEAARERVLIQPWIADIEQRLQNARAILRSLAAVPIARIERERGMAQTEDWRAWLELSLIARDLRPPVSAQLRMLEDWRRRYSALSSMDAAQALADEIGKNVVPSRRIALMLPLSGRPATSGRAVMEGCLAWHYADTAKAGAVPEIAIIDTAQKGFDLAAAYDAAVSGGAEAVIGPLLKQDVERIAQEIEVRVPTLALNFTENGSAASGSLYEFGLDMRDEVRQLGESAFEQGFRSVLVLGDEGTRSADSIGQFLSAWLERGGRVVASLSLGELNAYREQLEHELYVDRSRERARELARTLGITLESEPRRRHDIDFVALFGEPEGARSIRPMLSFLYAGDLPVWATSQSRSALGDGRRDRDLEGLRVLDMPWFNTAERQLRQTTQDRVSAGGLDRLFALGADACRLQPRLGLLSHFDGFVLDGATGELRLASGRRIGRRADWFRVSNGEALAELPREVRPDTDPSTEGDQQWQEENGLAPSAD